MALKIEKIFDQLILSARLTELSIKTLQNFNAYLFQLSMIKPINPFLRSDYIDINSYLSALSNPLEGELANLELITADNQPLYISGGAGVVFKVRHKGATYALKCFTTVDPDLIDRYQSNQQYLDLHKANFIPNFRFIPDAITVDQWQQSHQLPVVLMEWVEGIALNSYICELCYANRLAELKLLTDRFLGFAQELLLSKMVHSDIKGDNILTDGTNFYLIDIDGLSIKGCNIQGEMLLSPWYSHPKEACYPHPRDHYPLAIIIASLLALEHDPRAAVAFHNGENIIFNPRLLTQGCDPAMEMSEGLFTQSYPLIRLKEYITSPSSPKDSLLPIVNDIISMRSGTVGRDDIIFPSTTGSLDIVKRSGGKYGFVDSSGRVVIEAIYCDVKDFRESRAAVRHKGKWHYIDLEGNIIGEGRFDMATTFGCSLAAVRVGGLWGYINLSGEFVIKPTFRHASPFKEERAVVSDGMGYYYINTLGERVTSENFHWASPFSKGHAKVECRGEELTINKDGKVIDR